MRYAVLVGLLGLALALGGACGQDAPPVSKASVKKGCDRAANWLARQHNLEEGTFGSGKSAKMPGLVALVVVAMCESPREYREALGPFISEPVKYLLKCQRDDGAFAGPQDGLESYNTALAILALKATQNPKYAGPIAKAQGFLLKCQKKDGGFGYNLKGNEGDASNVWTALQALEVSGLPKDSEAYKNAAAFLRRCQDNSETNPDLAGKQAANTGGVGYKPGELRGYGSMTYAFVHSMCTCEIKKDAPELQAAFRWIRNNYTVKENPGMKQEGYYYYCLTFTKAMTAAGITELELPEGRKANWAPDLAGQLLALQKPDGSFVNAEPRWMENDPVLCTAFALRALTLCQQAMK